MDKNKFQKRKPEEVSIKLWFPVLIKGVNIYGRSSLKHDKIRLC